MNQMHVCQGNPCPLCYPSPSYASGGTGKDRDPNYDWVPPVQSVNVPRGRQCGECGMKFEYGQNYGYACPSNRCPMGWR